MIEPETKELIFDSALELIAKNSFEGVSIRDIANAVGIKTASLYYYYDSKQQILDHYYEYYALHRDEGRPEEAVFRDLMVNGTLKDIVDAITANSYIRMDEKVGRRMIWITKMIYSRKFFDPKAAELYLTHHNQQVNKIGKYLSYGIELGRFRPFDVEGVAYGMVVMYETMGVRAFVNPDYEPVKLDTENQILDWIVKLLRNWEQEQAGV